MQSIRSPEGPGGPLDRPGEVPAAPPGLVETTAGAQEPPPEPGVCALGQAGVVYGTPEDDVITRPGPHLRAQGLWRYDGAAGTWQMDFDAMPPEVRGSRLA